MRHYCWILLSFCLLLTHPLSAQEESPAPVVSQVSSSDSAKVVKHSPTVAMLCSIVPGGGQIYNRKYWKIPIVYGVLGASGYFLYYSAHKMITYRNEFIYRRDGLYTRLDTNLAKYDDEQLLKMKNDQRRNMEIAIGVTAVLYVLNIIDAMVDAHLFYFDVSDDLTLHWKPMMMQDFARRDYAFGINLQLHW